LTTIVLALTVNISVIDNQPGGGAMSDSGEL